MSETFTHDDTFLVFNPKDAGSCGGIDFRLVYRVTRWGRPEQGPSYASGGEPAEGPEIEVESVLMLGPPLGDDKPIYTPTWAWLYNEIDEWAHEHIDELMTEAGEHVQGQKEAAAEAKWATIREEAYTKAEAGK